MSDNFADYIARERERLHAERERIFNEQQKLEDELAAVNREFAAVEAYEAAKTGKGVPASRSAPRARRGSKREELLTLIRNHPGGLKRGEILELMGLKGNRAGEMSISNSLTNLTKTNQVRRADGKYRIA